MPTVLAARVMVLGACLQEAGCSPVSLQKTEVSKDSQEMIRNLERCFHAVFWRSLPDSLHIDEVPHFFIGRRRECLPDRIYFPSHLAYRMRCVVPHLQRSMIYRYGGWINGVPCDSLPDIGSVLNQAEYERSMGVVVLVIHD